MDKIGPLSIETVVACAVYHLRLIKRVATFDAIANLLKKKISRDVIPRCLRSLLDWGILDIKYESSFRTYFVSLEAYSMVKEIYEIFWERVKIE
jgi:hypothetical protein